MPDAKPDSRPTKPKSCRERSDKSRASVWRAAELAPAFDPTPDDGRDDLSPKQAWKVIDWCIERGGDEFLFRPMGLGESPTLHEPLTKALMSFHRGTPKRENMTRLVGEETRGPTDTWRLSTESARVLRKHTESVFVAPSYSMDGWFEDFTIYRHGEVMLGVISHEGIVVLRLTEGEHREFSGLKIESHETAS